MTSRQFRQSFLDFFRDRGHEIVPSAPLLPSAPNLLFTNAGMNAFVPFFLGERKAPWPRAADTQKCIRAGGKHNDLEDVGFDTYHHTFFEMLGNWSFGDYFKTESLEWGWQLLTEVWKIPPKRLFATVYHPGSGEPAGFDREAHEIWSRIFENEGLDPAVHIVPGNKEDNFWMMGDTGPCGPCSEIHFNLMDDDDEVAGRALVNQDSPRCIEIWNHVFIQFNALPNGSFAPLSEKHVDTGMGFERVAGIHATTRGFTDFSREPSNYDADLFTEIFDTVSNLSGKQYLKTIPTRRDHLEEQEAVDVAFRVLADHARCIACAIADGILPGNEGRQYVIRRILRRGILYGQKLQLETGFFEQLVDPVVRSLGLVFPELREQQDVIRRVIRSEEEAFGRTLKRGLAIFDHYHRALEQAKTSKDPRESSPRQGRHAVDAHGKVIAGSFAFDLYDTYGFPLDMTELLARERGLEVDKEGFQSEMDAQRSRARAAQKKETIQVRSKEAGGESPTLFVGFAAEVLEDHETELVDVVRSSDQVYLCFASTPFYAERGGQVGDTGKAEIEGTSIEIIDTIPDDSGRILHRVGSVRLPDGLKPGVPARMSVDSGRRRSIERNHTATHLLNWALRTELGAHVRQAGSLVSPDHLRFDFSHFESPSSEELRRIEERVNQRILENATVNWYEVPMEEKPSDVVATFGEKYGDIVRVIDIGAEVELGADHTLVRRRSPGYSAELCGGTHVRATGEIGPFKLLAESSIAAGTRRIEAVAGIPALERFLEVHDRLNRLADRLSCPPDEIEARLESLIEQRNLLEKTVRAADQRGLAAQAAELKSKALDRDGLKWLVASVRVANPDELRELGSQVSKSIGPGVVVLGAVMGEKVSLVALASQEAIERGHRAGDIIRDLASQLGGKGGGKPDFAMGGARNPESLDATLQGLVAEHS